MKIPTGLFLFAAIGLTSCVKQQTTTADRSPAIDTKAEAQKLNDLLAAYEEPSQVFVVPASEPTQVTGKQGTTISIHPDDLTTESGESLGENIQIELKELTHQSQLLTANAQTISNGKLLVSGGAYYINMTSNGKQLKLKEGKTMSVSFPKLTDNEMSLFYGQRDSLGKINWEQANESFKTKASTAAESIGGKKSNYAGWKADTLPGYIEDDRLRLMTKEEKLEYEKEKKFAQKVYDAVNIKSFGWINCDRFLEVQSKTDLLVNFNPSDSVASANVYLVFKDINSLMQSYYFLENGKTSSQGFKDIPLGSNVRLVAYTMQGEKVFSYASDITVKDKQTLTLPLKETSEAELKKLFND